MMIWPPSSISSNLTSLTSRCVILTLPAPNPLKRILSAHSTTFHLSFYKSKQMNQAITYGIPRSRILHQCSSWHPQGSDTCSSACRYLWQWSWDPHDNLGEFCWDELLTWGCRYHLEEGLGKWSEQQRYPLQLLVNVTCGSEEISSPVPSINVEYQWYTLHSQLQANGSGILACEIVPRRNLLTCTSTSTN